MPGLPDLRRDVLEALAGRIRALRAGRVAIDGPDAAGKTTLADELAGLLDGATRVSSDDFLNPAEFRYASGRDSPEGYYQHSFDYAELRAAVEGASGLVLVDGVFLQRPELDDLWSFRIFVAVAPEESLRRGVHRDRALHASPADAERLYRTRYLAGQELYAGAVRPRERADVVVENDDPARPRLVWREGVRRPGS